MALQSFATPLAFFSPRGQLSSTMKAFGGFHIPPALDESASLGRIGNLEVRLATKAKEVRRAQKLRWKVFYEEMSATPEGALRFVRRDVDRFDAICDHLIVLDHDTIVYGKMGKPRPALVGTYRVLRGDVAARNGGFYTQSEFDIAPLLARHQGKKFLELGRSCVLKPYRTKRIVELLWHGIWAYVLRHNIDVMFGCASLEGTNPSALALPLSFLHHHARASEEWSASALPKRRLPMDRLSAEGLDMKAALNALPPLIKGYLRVGAMIGDGAVVDHQFGTTDVLVVLPKEAIKQRYVTYYGADAGRHAA
jgi:putative hemolysin